MDQIFLYRYRPSCMVRVSGEDAAEFLQSQFSNELRPFEPGSAVYGLWLDLKGKVTADSVVMCYNREDFILFSESSPGQGLRDKLEHHVIADDVVLELLPEHFGLRLLGGSLESVFNSLRLAFPENGRFVVHEDDGIVAFPWMNKKTSSVELIFESEPARECFVAKLAQMAKIEEVSEEWIQLRRVESGLPSVPKELGATDLPGEGGLVSSAVSLTKGCFLGQEVVARMHNVGRAQRGLYIVSGEGPIPEVSQELFIGERKRAGELRSAYQEGDCWRGVAMLKHRLVASESLLTMTAGACRVEGLLQEASNG